MIPPLRDPLMPGDVYSPPGQSGTMKYWWRRSSADRYSSTDEPFNPKPYLWVSALIEVTPGRRKSNTGTGYPRSSPHARMNPPRHPSTCSRVSRSTARSESSAIGSTRPCGYVPAEPTSDTVSSSTNDRTESMSATNRSVTAAWRTSMPK